MKKVEVTIEINTTGEKVISAFTDRQMLHDWWQVDRTLIEKKVNGLYTLAWNIGANGFGFVSSGIIKEYVSGSLLVIDKFVYLNPGKSFLGPMTLTIKVTSKKNSVELYLCQDGYQEGSDWDWYYQAVQTAWPIVLKELKNYLEKNGNQ